MSKEIQKIDINFNPDLFNNVFWHIRDSFANFLIRFIWIYGGSSASKSFSVVQATIIEMMEGENNNTLILRKFAVDIRDSIYSDFKNIIADWELTDKFIIQQNYIKCKGTGSYVRFRGLDDSEKIKGITNFKRVILEEISQFDEIDFKQIRKRLRGRKGQQIVGIFNPITEEHWIKMNVFDKHQLVEKDSGFYHKEAGDKIPITGLWMSAAGNSIIMKTTYQDNIFIVGKWRDGKLVAGFVDQHTIDDFERDRIEDNNYYQIYGLGNWGKLRTGGEFWKEYNPNIHLVPNKKLNGYYELYNPALPIHMSWDKNVNPYQPCSLWQIEVIRNDKGETIKKKIWQIDEYAFEDPRNRVSIVCQAFAKDYPSEIVKGLFIYGDKTAAAEDSTKEKGSNLFTEVMGYLKAYRPTLRLQSVNPSVEQSKKFIEEIYARNYESIHVAIGDNCKKSDYDYKYALEDSDGTLKKTTKKHPVTGVTYQEFGHFSDMKRYIFIMAFPSEYAKFLKYGRSTKPTIGRSIPSKHTY